MLRAATLQALGVAQGDTEADGEWLTQKIAALRIFEDADGKMTRVRNSLEQMSQGALPESASKLLEGAAKE